MVHHPIPMPGRIERAPCVRDSENLAIIIAESRIQLEAAAAAERQRLPFGAALVDGSHESRRAVTVACEIALASANHESDAETRAYAGKIAVAALDSIRL
jgi:hypothetical protein